MKSQLGLIEQSFNVRYALWVREALDELPDSFTITDPCISGHPIVFASPGFLKMSGYSRDEVIGKNGRIFQGPMTSRRSVMEIREAIREERTAQINILNYRKDGTPFLILFQMCPLFSKVDGRVIHFVGVQVPILRKQRLSGSRFGRNGLNLWEDDSGFRETLLGSCRREVYSDSVVESGRVWAMDLVLGSDDREVEVDEHYEASDVEKRKAATAINNILSVLSHYSEGRVVCGKRCCFSGIGLLGSSLNISLERTSTYLKCPLCMQVMTS